MSTTETTHARPDLPAAVGWIDANVRDAAGRRLGRVKAVFADRDGRPWWLVVQRRGRTLVAPVTSVADASGRRLLLDRPADELAPAESENLTAAAHEALLRRFGLDRRRSERRPARRSREACARDQRSRRPGA
jgi:hypothetical protein